MKLTKEDFIEINKLNLQSVIVNEVENLRKKRGLSKTDIADALNVKSSFVTQLFQGSKFFNLDHLARLKYAFNLRVDMKFSQLEERKFEEDEFEFATGYEMVGEIPSVTDNWEDYGGFYPLKQA